MLKQLSFKHREEQEPPEEEEEVNSYSSEEDSDAIEQCRLMVLQQMIGEPMSPPKSQAQETKKEAESTDVVRSLNF